MQSRGFHLVNLFSSGLRKPRRLFKVCGKVSIFVVKRKSTSEEPVFCVFPSDNLKRLLLCSWALLLMAAGVR